MSIKENLKRDGISLDDLPPTNTRRWVIRRKAVVVDAVATGLITVEEACRRYSLSIEEFLSWQKAMETHGSRGLRATRVQYYRSTKNAPQGATAD